MTVLMNKSYVDELSLFEILMFFSSDFVSLSMVRLPQHLMNKAFSFHHLKLWAQYKVVVTTQMIKAYSFFVNKF